MRQSIASPSVAFAAWVLRSMTITINFMAPIGWELAGIVWIYAFAWFVVNDRIKLFAYRVFDRPQGNIV